MTGTFCCWADFSRSSGYRQAHSLLAGDDLELLYRHTLHTLVRETGLIGTIFRKAHNKLTDPAKLKRVVSLIDAETWTGIGIGVAIGVDVKGEIYGVARKERRRGEVRRRPVRHAQVTDQRDDVMDPRRRNGHDAAYGTGGFLLAGCDHMKGQSQDRTKQRRLPRSRSAAPTKWCRCAG
jgi:type I restriction enzyme M protein